MDILPEPCKRDSTHSWGDDTTETGATEPSHAASGDETVEEHETLSQLQVAGQLETEMGDPPWDVSVTETPPALK